LRIESVSGRGGGEISVSWQARGGREKRLNSKYDIRRARIKKRQRED